MNLLKEYIDTNDRNDYYYQDPLEEDTTNFVFPEFDDFYSFITREDNCLEEPASEELWDWYSTGICSGHYILSHHQHLDRYSDLRLKSKCVYCPSYYELEWHPYYNNPGPHTTFNSRGIQGNIIVRYTSEGLVSIEYRMICNRCIIKTGQRFIFLFEELKEKIQQTKLEKRITMIGSLQENMDTYRLGECQLIRNIIIFIE